MVFFTGLILKNSKIKDLSPIENDNLSSNSEDKLEEIANDSKKARQLK